MVTRSPSSRADVKSLASLEPFRARLIDLAQTLKGERFMDISVLIPTLAAALFGVLGYFLRRLVMAHDKLEKLFDRERRITQEALTQIRGDYLKSAEFARFQSSIDHKLTQIYDLLMGR